MTTISSEDSDNQQKKRERNMFIFLAVFLAPILSIAIVAGFGFLVWINQIIFGPPTV